MLQGGQQDLDMQIWIFSVSGLEQNLAEACYDNFVCLRGDPKHVVGMRFVLFCQCVSCYTPSTSWTCRFGTFFRSGLMPGMFRICLLVFVCSWLIPSTSWACSFGTCIRFRVDTTSASGLKAQTYQTCCRQTYLGHAVLLNSLLQCGHRA